MLSFMRCLSNLGTSWARCSNHGLGKSSSGGAPGLLVRTIVSELRPQNVPTRKLFKGSWMKRTDGSLIGTYPTIHKYGLRATMGKRLAEAELQKILDFLKLKKKSKAISGFKINVVPDHPITKKLTGSRMGGGRGEIICYGKWVAEGDLIVEFDVSSDKDRFIIARALASFLSVPVSIVSREETIALRDMHIVPTFILERIRAADIEERAKRAVKRLV